MSETIPSRLRLRIISERRLLVDAEVEEIAVPGLEGEVGILPGHRPLILGLGSGSLHYRQGTQEKGLPVKGGYATISPGDVIVFVELSQDEGSKPADRKG